MYCFAQASFTLSNLTLVAMPIPRVAHNATGPLFLAQPQKLRFTQ